MSPLVAGVLAVLSVVDIAPTNTGAALTLPSQHHSVRMTPSGTLPAWLIAIQQRGAQSNGLGFFKSTNEGQTWSYVGPIQDDWTEPDNADLVPVGQDIALIYSFETYSSTPISGSTRHDVVFQWWRYNSTLQTWEPDPPVTVFDSTSSSTAYYRAQLTRDGLGRFWVLAFKLESNGTSSVDVAVSTNEGASFSLSKILATGLPNRGGGTIDAINGKVLVLYDQNNDPYPSRFLVRSDSDPLGTWSANMEAFPDGIYHGAALSTAVGGGKLHIVYKNGAEQLFYRSFDGTSFSNRTLIDDRADWAMQPALTYVGDKLFIFWNHQRTSSSYEIRLETLESGMFSPYTVINGSVSWKGYLSAAEFLPTSAPKVLCAYGNAPNASTAGTVQVVSVSRSPTPPPDAGTPDAGTGLPFSDNFNRPNQEGLGPNWTVQLGAWMTRNGEAQSELTTTDLARVSAPGTTCRDCSVQADVVGFGVPSTALFLRESASSPFDRYEVAITGSNTVQIRRFRGGTATVLGTASTGLSSLNTFAKLSLDASGAGPVRLVARINGVVRLDLSDSSAQAITTSGSAGLSTTHAGVVFDNFRLGL